MTPNHQTATEAARAIREGILSSEELVRACLAQIAASDPVLQAWKGVDEEGALEQAREMDMLRRAGRPLGTLHGVPVGIGAAIDVAGSDGAEHDAMLVSRLRESGAVILGRTAASPFGATRPSGGNPHSPACSRGDGGACAAVAATQVPLAVDRQQAGELLLSASFCGTFGMVPTRGIVSRGGAFRVAESLDRIGVAARSLEDAALLADAIAGYDRDDPASHLRPKPRMRQGVDEAVPIEPNFVAFQLPYADRQSPDSAAAFGELAEALGARIETVLLPESYLHLIDHRNIVLAYERARSIRAATGAEDAADPELAELVRQGLAIGEQAYGESLAAIRAGTSFLDELLNEFDAILTPAATGATSAEVDLRNESLFTAIFDGSGLPSLTLPMLGDGRNLPIGVQLVSGPDEDARLFRTARWLQTYLSEL